MDIFSVVGLAPACSILAGAQGRRDGSSSSRWFLREFSDKELAAIREQHRPLLGETPGLHELGKADEG